MIFLGEDVFVDTMKGQVLERLALGNQKRLEAFGAHRGVQPCDLKLFKRILCIRECVKEAFEGVIAGKLAVI